jgi:hypothetical protein
VLERSNKVDLKLVANTYLTHAPSLKTSYPTDTDISFSHTMDKQSRTPLAKAIQQRIDRRLRRAHVDKRPAHRQKRSKKSVKRE